MPTTDTSPFFLPYQKRWIEDNARIKLMEKSRQIGLSWTSAYRCMRRIMSGEERAIWVSSRDELQARLFVEDCKRFVTIFHDISAPSGWPLLGSQSATALSIELTNGCRLHSLSSNADAQAGKRGSRVLDEFALHPDPRQLYAIAYPGITWGGSLEILSTHRGASNYFNSLIGEIADGNPKQISHHRVTLQDALEQGFLTKLKTKLPADDERQCMDEAAYFDFIRNACPDESTFQQEYCCNPADDHAALLTAERIHACELADHDWQLSPKQLREPVRQLFLGVDIGRDRDLTVFYLIERIHDTLFTRAIRCLEQTPFDEQETILADYMRLPGLRKVAIDQTGLGRQFAERATRRYGPSRVEGVHFTQALKEDLAYPLRAAFEAQRIRIPADDALFADLRSIRVEPAIGGGIRFTSARLAGSHADRFWALALAIRCAQSRVTNFHYTNIR